MSVHVSCDVRVPRRTPWLPPVDWRGLTACALFGVRFLASLPARQGTTNGARA